MDAKKARCSGAKNMQILRNADRHMECNPYVQSSAQKVSTDKQYQSMFSKGSMTFHNFMRSMELNGQSKNRQQSCPRSAEPRKRGAMVSQTRKIKKEIPKELKDIKEEK